MKTKKYWFLVVVIICFGLLLSVKVLGISSNEEEQLEKFGVSTLHGLKGICPVISIATSVEMEGDTATSGDGKKEETDYLGSLTRKQMETQVELALRRKGIKKFGSVTDFGLLIIYIEVNKIEFTKSVIVPCPLYVVKVSIELHQLVSLSRDPQIRTRAKTWPALPIVEGRGIRFTTRELMGKHIKEDIARQMEVFCNDYLAANPKEVSPKSKNNK